MYDLCQQYINSPIVFDTAACYKNLSYERSFKTFLGIVFFKVNSTVFCETGYLTFFCYSSGTDLAVVTKLGKRTPFASHQARN